MLDNPPDFFDVIVIYEFAHDGTDDVLADKLGWAESFSQRDFKNLIFIAQCKLNRLRNLMGLLDHCCKALVFCVTQDHAALVHGLIITVKTRLPGRAGFNAKEGLHASDTNAMETG